MAVRTRIAPSPTGAPHIGTAYIALFNYAFARRNAGRFVLRVEDTDRARSTPESEAAIFAALRWLGLAWDEGPDVGGPYGPYRQSERSPVYRQYVEPLVRDGRAYPCFCAPGRLAELRRQQEQVKGTLGYDGLCAGLDASEARRRIEAGEPHVIRLRAPREGECAFRDRLRGEIRIPWNMVDDQVLIKADGFPTYHFAVVVDDHLMEITHVIRGEEWISSTPKHLLLYEGFGWTAPEFAHLPLLRNPDKSKLSKRRNPTSILYYRQAGYLPEALINFLGLIAYSPPDGEEMFSLAKMAETFDLDRVSLGGPIFDLDKLRHFNGRYLRALSPSELMGRLQEWMLNEETWRRILPLAQPRLEQLADVVPMSAYLFADRPVYDAELLVKGTDDPKRVPEWLKMAQWEIEQTRAWDAETAQAVFARMSERENVKLKKLMMPFYVALAGSAVSMPIFDSMAIMGRDMCLRRLQYAGELLDAGGHGLSGKDVKRLMKDYEARYGAGIGGR